MKNFFSTKIRWLYFILTLILILLAGFFFRYRNDQKFLAGQTPWLPGLVSASAIDRKINILTQNSENWNFMTFSCAEIDQKIAQLAALVKFSPRRQRELQIAQIKLEQLYDEKLFNQGNPEAYLADPRGKKYVEEMRQKLDSLNQKRKHEAMKLIDRLPLNNLKAIRQKISAVEKFSTYTDVEKAQVTEICTVMKDFLAQPIIKITIQNVSGLKKNTRTNLRICTPATTSFTSEYPAGNCHDINAVIQFTPGNFSATIIEWWQLDWRDKQIAHLQINTPLELVEKLGTHEMTADNWDFFSTTPAITLHYPQWTHDNTSRYQQLLHKYIYPGTFWKIAN